MERLTANKEVSEMSMIELAYNSCYEKDHQARYRDYDTDIDARKLTIKLLEKFDVPNEFTCDEDFDDFMLDASQYGIDKAIGLIAVFYINLWAKADLRERLKEYEDLEEQGLLLKLPCKVGDTLYRIDTDENLIKNAEIKCFTIENIVICKDGDVLFKYDAYDGVICHLENIITDKLYLDFYRVFLTQSEAEEALKKMEEKEK